ncbi:Transposable element Tc3 transposase [Dictyocoela muelleri]|nr:Transposable element Tc3 transposase [Dictyocoela muelleri]
MSRNHINNEIKPRKTRNYITKETIRNFLHLLRLEKKQSEIMSALNLSRSTVNRMTQRAINGDFDEDKKIISTEERKRGPKKDISLRTDAINLELAINSCTTLNSISLNLKNNRSITTSLATISRNIKSMGFTRKIISKIPISRNSDANKTTRYIYANLIREISDNELIFLDESGFNLHLTRKYGYSKKNCKAYTTVPNSKGANVSFLCSISIEGIYCFRIKVGSFKSSDMLDFISNELPLLTNRIVKHIVLDNASIHKTNDVVRAFAQRGYILHFLPPYSPHLNPIEEFFSAFKSKFVNMGPCRNLEAIANRINEIANSNRFEMVGFYKHMRDWVEKSILREDLI